mgnify:CR=1|jgi:hypothetical protein
MIIFHLSEKDPEYFWVLLFCYILLYGVWQIFLFYGEKRKDFC